MKLAAVGVLVVLTVHLSVSLTSSSYCYWEGTAPFCPSGCPHRFVEKERHASGDGARCWIGRKTYCCLNIPRDTHCTWTSSKSWLSYLFCMPIRCPYGYYPIARSGLAHDWCFDVRTLCCSRLF